MSLNISDLDRQASLGNKKAKVVLTYRKNAHLTFTAILLTNVAFASATSIVLAGQLNGFIAAAISTLLLVFFGELLPQALFQKARPWLLLFFFTFIEANDNYYLSDFKTPANNTRPLVW